MKIIAISLFEKQTDPNGIYVNTTSKAVDDWQRELSPFFLGPCPLYSGLVGQNVENSWQYSKVYPEHVAPDGTPSTEYWAWAKAGWADKRPQRYPMGKGRKPSFSWWNGEKYTYVEARKRAYGPLYANAVVKTKGYAKLLEIAGDTTDTKSTLYLRDYDAYRHEDLGMTYYDVMNHPVRKMGHAFVLAMLLKKDIALNEFYF